MDASSTPGRTVRLLLEVNRAPDGRIEGRMAADDIGPDTGWTVFSGVLELLKALEERA